ncbi:MAG: Rrf2 family transcriptional regulator [Acidimicrobiales bacterium]|jgi:Rrf2 family protein
MNMTLSRRGDYVVRSAISLARAYHEGIARKIREVVEETEIPRTFASQILADLVRAGVADSKAGRNGGYRLVRAPDLISVLEVVEAAEGPLHADRCALGEGPCRWEAVCPLHETWSDATSGLRAVLASTTLAELAARDRDIEVGTYKVPQDSHRSGRGVVPVTGVVHVELKESVAGNRLRRLEDRLGALLDSALAAVGGREREGGGLRPQPPGTDSASSEPTRGASIGSEASLRPLSVEDDVRECPTAGRWGLSVRSDLLTIDSVIETAVVDSARCELRFAGVVQPGLTIPTARQDNVPFDRLAERTVRVLLCLVARALESESDELGAA